MLGIPLRVRGVALRVGEIAAAVLAVPGGPVAVSAGVGQGVGGPRDGSTGLGDGVAGVAHRLLPSSARLGEGLPEVELPVRGVHLGGGLGERSGDDGFVLDVGVVERRPDGALHLRPGLGGHAELAAAAAHRVEVRQRGVERRTEQVLSARDGVADRRDVLGHGRVALLGRVGHPGIGRLGRLLWLVGRSLWRSGRRRGRRGDRHRHGVRAGCDGAERGQRQHDEQAGGDGPEHPGPAGGGAAAARVEDGADAPFELRRAGHRAQRRERHAAPRPPRDLDEVAGVRRRRRPAAQHGVVAGVLALDEEAAVGEPGERVGPVERQC